MSTTAACPHMMWVCSPESFDHIWFCHSTACGHTIPAHGHTIICMWTTISSACGHRIPACVGMCITTSWSHVILPQHCMWAQYPCTWAQEACTWAHYSCTWAQYPYSSATGILPQQYCHSNIATAVLPQQLCHSNSACGHNISTCGGMCTTASWSHMILPQHCMWAHYSCTWGTIFPACEHNILCMWAQGSCMWWYVHHSLLITCDIATALHVATIFLHMGTRSLHIGNIFLHMGTTFLQFCHSTIATAALPSQLCPNCSATIRGTVIIVTIVVTVVIELLQPCNDQGIPDRGFWDFSLGTLKGKNFFLGGSWWISGVGFKV